MKLNSKGKETPKGRIHSFLPISAFTKTCMPLFKNTLNEPESPEPQVEAQICHHQTNLSRIMGHTHDDDET